VTRAPASRRENAQEAQGVGVGWLERAVREARPGPLPTFYELAVRDRCDLPDGSDLEWLLEPALRRRFPFPFVDVPLEVDADAAAVGERNHPIDDLRFGTERLVLSGIGVFPPSPHGRKRETNYRRPPEVPAVLFVSAMEDVPRVLERSRSLLATAARRGHGVVAQDGLDP
jgi:hypothetical protein